MITNDMMISSEVERFKNGEIRQGAFLKALKDDIFRMVNQNISLPGQIAILEKQFDITLNYLTYKSWVVYNKKKLLNEGEQKNEGKSIRTPHHGNTENEVKVSKNDSEKTLEEKEADRKKEKVDHFKNLVKANK